MFLPLGLERACRSWEGVSVTVSVTVGLNVGVGRVGGVGGGHLLVPLEEPFLRPLSNVPEGHHVLHTLPLLTF